MSTDRHRRMESLFAEAASMPRDRAEEFLRREAADDPSLVKEVLGLLEYHPGASGEIFERATVSSTAEVPPPRAVPGEQPGENVGPYRLIRRLGTGSFGIVWLAQQRNPSREVALKILKPGMDSVAVLARFDQERQALARMSHAHIASILEGGATSSGRPYFVMEAVSGEPITSVCDAHRFSIRERLQLFMLVCDAVHHAHQKGILHRDIKPSNILVSMVDGQPVPKVIDFGIAKAVTHLGDDVQFFTDNGVMMGTPAYMSPEQAKGSVEVDTTTDVYSLGVVLYELLVGRLPFDAIREGDRDRIRMMIAELEPPSPSRRVADLSHSEASEIAARRSTNPKSLANELRRELELMPMMAMRKDPARRYASAEAFGADIRRYLQGDPLLAAPESRMYRVRKFVARRRLPIAAAAGLLASLVVGIIGTSVALSRAVRAEESARTRAEDLKRIVDFQSSVFNNFNPMKAGLQLRRSAASRLDASMSTAGLSDSDQMAERESFGRLWDRVNPTDLAISFVDANVLDPAIAAIDERFQKQPLVKAALLATMAKQYREFGLYPRAVALETRALEIRAELLGPDNPEVLLGRVNLGLSYQLAGDTEQAEMLARSGLVGLTRTLGERHESTLEAMVEYGYFLSLRGRVDEALSLLSKVVKLSEAYLGEVHEVSIHAKDAYALTLQEAGRKLEAIPLLEQLLVANEQKYGQASFQACVALNNLGTALFNAGRALDSEAPLRECLSRRITVCGDSHHSTLETMNSLCFILGRNGKCEESREGYKKLLSLVRRANFSETPDGIRWRKNSALSLRWCGDPAAAARELQTLLAIPQGQFPDERVDVDELAAWLAITLSDLGRFDEVESLAARLDMSRAGMSTRTKALCRIARGRSRSGLHQFEEAESEFRIAQELTQALPFDSHGLMGELTKAIDALDRERRLAPEQVSTPPVK